MASVGHVTRMVRSRELVVTRRWQSIVEHIMWNSLLVLVLWTLFANEEKLADALQNLKSKTNTRRNRNILKNQQTKIKKTNVIVCETLRNFWKKNIRNADQMNEWKGEKERFVSCTGFAKLCFSQKNVDKTMTGLEIHLIPLGLKNAFSMLARNVFYF